MIKAKRTYLATGAQRPGLGRGISRTYAGAQRDARRAVREVREPYVGLVLSGKDADERGWKFWLETRKAARNHKPSPLSLSHSHSLSTLSPTRPAAYSRP
jgi:hypothetical protein